MSDEPRRPQWPWAVLGLPGHLDDARDIRAACAKALMRIDQSNDIASFTALRHAYEAAREPPSGREVTAPGPLADIGPTGLVAAVPAEPVAEPGPVPAETSGMTDVINAWLQEFETNSDAKDQNKALADLLANDLASRAEAAAPLRQAMIRLIRCTIRPGQDGQLSLSLQLTDESLQRINAWTGWLADYRACQRDFGQDNVKLDMLVGRLVGQKVPAKTRAARGRFDWIISRLMLFCVFIPFAFGRGLWGRRAVLDNC